MNRDELIRVATTLGLRASKRDWVLGKTVQLLADPSYVDQRTGLTIYKRMMYLVEHPSGWIADDCSGFCSLVLNQESVLEFIESWHKEASLAKFRDNEKSLTPSEIEDHIQETAKSIVWGLKHMVKWIAPNSKKGNCLFTSREEMAEVWLAHGGDLANLPIVDFDKYMVVAMFMDAGEYFYSPAVQSVQAEGGLIKVYFRWSKSSWKMINPCSVIKVAKAEGRAIFIEQS